MTLFLGGVVMLRKVMHIYREQRLWFTFCPRHDTMMIKCKTQSLSTLFSIKQRSIYQATNSYVCHLKPLLWQGFLNHESPHHIKTAMPCSYDTNYYRNQTYQLKNYLSHSLYHADPINLRYGFYVILLRHAVVCSVAQAIDC